MPRKKNPQETIQNILMTALELFKTKGYEQTTILDIVETMGVSRGAFYHHFKSKEEVLGAILAQRADIEWQSEVFSDPNLTGLEKLRKLMFLDKQEGYNNQEDSQLMYMSLSMLKDPRIMAEHIKDSQGEGQNAVGMKLLVDAGIADGSIAKQDSQLLTELILLLLGFWIVPTIYIPETLESFQDKILMIKSILDGLGCPVIDEEVIQIYTDIAKDYEEEDEKYGD